MTEELKPCKMCGKIPERYETRSHVIIECQSDDDSSPKDYHRVFIARSSESGALIAWNLLNQPNEPDALPEWLIAKLNRFIENNSMSESGWFIEWKDCCKWILSLRKPEDE